MIGLDTNVVIRYIAQDDPRQSAKATQLMENLSSETPGFLPLVALVEIVWVLAGRYAASKADTIKIVETLLRTKELYLEQSETVWRALRLFASSNADFADCLIVRSCDDAKCTYTATFDAKAARTAGMRLID
ncbi:MAG TPA: type II toxin-antitoxin system VapC family toxin [Phyllobacterium sp.]|nr:type II toxin-antitoxin system VapC family toxin [Phyllobacterium sp.]